MHLKYILVMIKVAFVAESFTTVNQNIQIYFAALQLDARFDAPVKPEKMPAISDKGRVRQKICGTGKRGYNRPIIIISLNYTGQQKNSFF